MEHILEKEFENYLNAVGLGNKPKNSVEIIERRRSFYAGASVMNQKFTVELPEIDTEEKSIEYIESLQKELRNFNAGVEIGER